MIEGLHYDFTSAEVKKHLEDRAAYHRKRCDIYQNSLDKLGGQEDAEDVGASKSGRKDIDDKIKSHKNTAVQFELLAAHLIPNEVYRLKKSDMAEIGLIDRGY